MLVPAGSVLRPVEVGVLEVLVEGGPPLHVVVVGMVGRGGVREGPELVLVVLRSQQGGDHGQCPSEGSVGLCVDQQLVGESSPVTCP